MTYSHSKTSNLRCSCMNHNIVHETVVHFITLALGEECEGYAIGYVCLSVCLSVRTRNSKTIATIDLIFIHVKYYTCSLVLL